MNRTSFRRAMVPTAAALMLGFGLAACSAGNADDDSPDAGSDSGLSGELAGGGASSQDKAQQAWRAGFQSANPDVTITYDPVGSGDGRQNFISGAFSFAGSDSYLSDDEGELSDAKAACGGEDPIEVPAYVSPIAVAFNLEGVDSLNLSAKTIAQIFDGKITKWNDPLIANETMASTCPTRRSPRSTARTTRDHGQLHRLPVQGRRRRLELRRGRRVADQRAAKPPRGPPESSARSPTAKAPSATPTTAPSRTPTSASCRSRSDPNTTAPSRRRRGHGGRRVAAGRGSLRR